MKKRKYISKFHEGDFWLIVTTLALSLFGLIMVFSASYYTGLSKYSDALYYLKQNVVWVAGGWVVFLVFAAVDYHFLKKLAPVILGIGFVLLCLIFTPMGITINNATRWLDFKIFTVMPGEVIKFCMIVFIASFYSKDKNLINKPVSGILPVFGISLAAFLLIFRQPNFSTAGIVLMLCICMMIAAGLYWRWIIVGGGLVLGAGVGLFLFKGSEYMAARLDKFWDPFANYLGKGYQVAQSLIAFGSGGVFGIGMGKSVQKALYLPEPMNDFILPIIGEELGFVGVVCLIIVYIILIWRLFMVSINAKDRFGMLLAAGVAIHIGLQVIINIAVVTASFPPTGVVLPLISLGGTASLLIMGELGIAYNVSRQTEVDI